MIRPQVGWEVRRSGLYREHLETLDAPYYARGQERLEGQQEWTQGRAFKQVRSGL